MNTKKLSQWVIILIATSLLLAGCGGKVPVPLKETATPIPPTTTNLSVQSTSKYILKCNIDALNYSFEIIGETGTVQSTFNNEKTSYDYDPSGQMSGITLSVNRDLLFKNNQHSYHIEGTITVKQATNEVTYDIIATGNTFGNSPQICKKP